MTESIGNSGEELEAVDVYVVDTVLGLLPADSKPGEKTELELGASGGGSGSIIRDLGNCKLVWRKASLDDTVISRTKFDKLDVPAFWAHYHNQERMWRDHRHTFLLSLGHVQVSYNSGKVYMIKP